MTPVRTPSSRRRLVPLCLGLALGAGCAGPTLVGRAADRNPLLKPDFVSEGVAIPIKDPQIIANAGQAVDPASHAQPSRDYASTGAQWYHPTFHQSAIFEARSPNDLVFLIELCNRWPELTHVENYDVTLSDEKGHVFRPSGVRGTPAHVIMASMLLGRSDVVHMTVKTVSGQTISYSHGEDASGDTRNMLAARSLVEFEGRPVITPETKRLRLRLKSAHRSLEFVWEFNQ
jgi:hypothetical protein